ncbi:type V CRISPR-associated protein Cas12a/Cpf1 [Brumimicrobium aurantiacum]|uniref:Type V CRISPR-associated protein Cpf1 n=1 Tax=Brumimicrobium aurantiacum TaxID=1737063 RepID=A0A3E1EYK1_9FLAO|nr:type V CRISPR-associated protein Cas12a/Cpf1 [Brumimicrobium aurantiacum]RFC54641.1 type V CRISPR-associated protein Cpf1 [Brumimicrobium aurantiacum]
MKNQINLFTNKFQLSKTLRFELKPQGKTLEHINSKGFIKNDEKRADSYKKMKATIDAFHRDFIDLAMSNVKLTNLIDFEEIYNASNADKKDEKYKTKLSKIQEILRKEIAKGFKGEEVKDIFSKIDKKDLITKLLEEWIIENKIEDIHFDPEFKNFTTYFSGFHQNRKNMYTDQEQSTAIAYRLIHENLPRFIDNINIFQKINKVPDLEENLKKLYQEIEEYLGINAINEAFELEYFNETLSQKGIDIYNLILGGRTAEEGKQKIQGLNEYINLYNQKQDKKNRVPKLKVLYKQILSDRTRTSFLPDTFEDDEESSASQKVLDSINNFYLENLIDYLPNDKNSTINVLENLKLLLAELINFELDKVYIKNDTSITNISMKIFKNYSVIREALNYFYENKIDPNFAHNFNNANTDKKREKLEKEKAKITKQTYLSISFIEEAIHLYINENSNGNQYKNTYKPNCIANYFKDFFIAENKEGSNKEFDFISKIKARYNTIKGVLNTPFPDNKRLHQEKNNIDNIKHFLDSIMEYLHFAKPLVLSGSFAFEKDEQFYTNFDELYNQLELIIPLYNKVRNYATQKPYSTEKFKLNFENSTLLNGWDVNKEEANTSILFIKNGFYYLGIMDKNHNKIFRNTPKSTNTDIYKKVNYKLLPGASKMLPKVFFGKKNLDYYKPSKDILRIRNHGTHTKGGKPQSGFDKLDFNLNDCHKLIDFFKDSIQKHPDWSKFKFKFSDTQIYESIDQFYRELEPQAYSITYTNIDSSFIEEQINEGKLYLFQIYNKDFSKFSNGKPNLHTLYWKALFDEQNLKDVTYKLNGEAEIFYRKKSIQHDRQIIHKRNQPIINKNPNNEKKESIFKYNIIKDKRYTIDKFQFHVPITLNFKAKGTDYINYDVLDYLKENPDVKIIGLDRGERHLIYLTLIDQKGKILEQISLNEIVNKKHNITTSYHNLLETKEIERDKARKNWGTVETIKELKEGYISQVVHKISKMMIEHNAIVVMEDLNMGFKRGRFKVEKQVYQKLEKMLIDKLNYLVLKDRQPNEPAGIYNALQLTNKFESFQKLGKQSGFLFYVPAWNTSKIDPTTGFVNLFHVKYESVRKSQEFFNKFNSIKYNPKEAIFEFDFDYNEFTTRAEGTKTNWTVCTYGDRIKTFRNPEKLNQWDNKEINITTAFEDFFGRHNITYGNGSDIKSQLISREEKDFFSELIHLFRLTLQMRNSKTNSEIDYLISPVKNENGFFYDSRHADKNLPKDADANGAYHIAKKGLQWIKEIQSFEGNEWKKLKLDKTNKGWLKFVQENQ